MKRVREKDTLPKPKKQKISHKEENIIPDIEDLHELPVISWKSKEHILNIQNNLLNWYDTKEKREMPWRLDHNNWESKKDKNKENTKEILTQRAYEVWVSEVMLQQTRVQTVIEYFTKWLTKFPTIDKLASSSLEEVNQLWAGLGYYRRAKYLHQGAQKVVNELNGNIPQTFIELQSLPGIGKYTAGAISSIVFGEQSAVVDGNVIRVISRVKMISDNPKLSKTVKLFWKLCEELVPNDRPGCFNQALMDLGSTLCTVKSPNCIECPIQKQCESYQASIIPNSNIQVTQFPTKVKKTEQRLELVSTCIFYYNSPENIQKYLIIQRPTSGLLASMWEFPTVILESTLPMKSRKKLQFEYIHNTVKLEQFKEFNSKSYKVIGKVNHEFSHIKQTLLVDACKIKNIDLNTNNDINMKWILQEDIESSALSKGMRKCFSIFLEKIKSNQPQLSTFFNQE